MGSDGEQQRAWGTRRGTSLGDSARHEENVLPREGSLRGVGLPRKAALSSSGYVAPMPHGRYRVLIDRGPDGLNGWVRDSVVAAGWEPLDEGVGVRDAHIMFASPTPDEGVLNVALAARGTDYRIAIMAPTDVISTLEKVLSPPEVTFLDTGYKGTGDRLAAWLRSLESRPSVSEMRSRGAVEALYRKVTLLVTENDDLLGLVNDYADQVERHKGELTEAQIEVRTLQAVLAQVDGYNQTLLLELSKRRVDKHTASLTVRAMMKAVDLAMTGAVTIGSTYIGTIAAQPPATLERVDAARIEVVAECDRTIQVIGGPFANLGDDMTGAVETD